MSATNLEIAINASFEADVENEGTLTLPAKILTSYVSLLTDEKVELSVTSGSVLEITTKGSDTKMKGISSEEFPLLPKLENPDVFKLPSKKVEEAIDQVAFAASTNISRPMLTGIFWQIVGKTMKLVATDSYRLGEKTLVLEKDVGADLSFIVPSKTALELAKILASSSAKDFEVRVAKGQILFKVDGVELMSRLIEGNFPDYEKILPKEAKTVAKLPTEEMILALKKISVIVRENSNNVRVKIGERKVEVLSEETQVGEARVSLSADTKGETLDASLNVQYLLDVLSHLKSEKVNFGLNDGLSPVMVSPAQESGYQHIIMPLKV